MTKKVGLFLCALLIAPCIGCGQEVKFIEVEPLRIEFKTPGETRQITVRATTSKGALVKEPPPFTFSSENPAIADVSPDGTVRAVSNGGVAITAKAPNGISGETYVSVCLPKEVVCEPKDRLDTRVGSAYPIKCHVTNCKGAKILKPEIQYDVVAKTTATGDKPAPAFEEGVMSFPVTGVAVGDTQVKITAYGLETTVGVHVDEALVIPGEAEYLARTKGGKKKGGGGGGKKSGNNDPDSGTKSGSYSNILNNMKFK